MIYVGYPCVGKSSICGKNNNIDLESSNFFYNVKETGEYKRDSSWSEVYINIAEDLSKQGFNVFVSSHGAVVAELKKRNIEFIGLFPSVHLKDKWIERATNRYNNNPCDKNKKALDRIISHFEEDVKSLKESCLDGKIMEINSYDYDLNEIITTLNRSDL